MKTNAIVSASRKLAMVQEKVEWAIKEHELMEVTPYKDIIVDGFVKQHQHEKSAIKTKEIDGEVVPYDVQTSLFDAIDAVDSMMDIVKINLNPDYGNGKKLLDNIIHAQYFIRNEMMRLYAEASNTGMGELMMKTYTRWNYSYYRDEWKRHEIIQYFHTWIYEEERGKYK